MSLTQNDRYDRYLAAGGETVYNYTFPILTETDIAVQRLRGTDVTTLVLGAGNDYTVTNVGNAAGGTIVLTAPALAADIYAIFAINEYRAATYNQLGGFLSADINADIDQSIMIGQQNRRDIDRSIRIPMVDPDVNLEIPIASERANKYLGFGVDGSVFVSESMGIDTDMAVTVDGDIVVWDGTNADKVKSADQAVRVPAGTTAQRPAPQAGMIRYNTTLAQIEGYDGGNWVNLLTSGTGAPIGVTYIVQQSDGVLTNEQAMADLATGIVKNTAGTGVQSIAIEGIDYYEPGGTNVAVADGGTGASTATLARTNLGLEIGTDVQAYDATLQSLSGLGTAANKMAYTTGVDIWAEADITAAGRAILDDADAATQRATLGLTIGTDVQAHSVRLDNVAAIGISGLVVFGGSNTAATRTITGSNGISITNGNAVAGNPDVAVDINGLTADLAPDGASDYVMTYDASAGANKKVLLNNLPGGGGGGGGGGKVLQVVTLTKTDTASTTSSTLVDLLGLSATITPTSTASRILVMVNMMVGSSTAGSPMSIRLMRGATAVGVGDASGTRTPATSASTVAITAGISPVTVSYVDSPATTSATTYKIQWAALSGTTLYLNRAGQDTDSSSTYRTITTLTLMEIGA